MAGLLLHVFHISNGGKRSTNKYTGTSAILSDVRIFSAVVKDKKNITWTIIVKNNLDNIFIIRQVIEKTKRQNNKTHMVFIDLEKVNDSAPKKQIWKQ